MEDDEDVGRGVRSRVVSPVGGESTRHDGGDYSPDGTGEFQRRTFLTAEKNLATNCRRKS